VTIISSSWDGQKRKLSSHVCEQCGGEFFAPLKAKAKYCSVSCFRLRPKKQTELVCAVCSKQFTRRASSVKNATHGIVFCSRVCKDKGQSISFGCKELWPPHYGSSNEYRNKVSLDECIGCGETRKFLLLVHHIDGNRRHNTKSNLECVCANCHVIRHLRFVDGEWLYWTKVLTPREKISEIMGV
jgi:hypothetical protein